VAVDSPGSLLGCGAEGRNGILAKFSRARRVKTVNLDAVFARAAYKRQSATLVGNCQLGSLTTGSPAGHLRERRFKGEHGCSSLALDKVWRPIHEGGETAALQTHGGSMYSLACRTQGVIPLDYCSLRDHGA
jgi:hypothetical protein